MGCQASEGVDVKENDTQKRDPKERSVNIDDPTKVASNLGDCATNKNNTVPDHLQDHDDKSGKNYKTRLLFEESGKKHGVKILRCWKTLQVSRQPEQNPAGQFFKDTIKTTQR